MPADDYIDTTDDLGGHIGSNANDNRYHGFGTSKEGDERKVDFADTHDFVLINTWSIERLSHLSTLYSGNCKIQIEYMFIKRPGAFQEWWD